MGYTIEDLLEKMLLIEQKAKTFYKNVCQMSSNLPKVELAASVLAKEEDRHIEYYKNLKSSFANTENIEISLDVYDKASSLIIEFKNKIINPNATSVQELLKFALDFENENIALIIKIRDRLAGIGNENNTRSNEILSILLEEERRHVRNIKKFIKE